MAEHELLQTTALAALGEMQLCCARGREDVTGLGSEGSPCDARGWWAARQCEHYLASHAARQHESAWVSYQAQSHQTMRRHFSAEIQLN